MNGPLSIIIAVMAIMRKKYYELLIVFQGILLIIWLTSEIIIMKLFYGTLHLPYYVTALILIITGYRLNKNKQNE
jgi:hypothetical protein